MEGGGGLEFGGGGEEFGPLGEFVDAHGGGGGFGSLFVGHD